MIGGLLVRKDLAYLRSSLPVPTGLFKEELRFLLHLGDGIYRIDSVLNTTSQRRNTFVAKAAPLSKIDVLREIYRAVDYQKTKAAGLTKERVKELFGHLAKLLQDEQPSQYDFLTLHTDGSTRGNPGKGGAGVILLDREGEMVEELGEYIGTVTSNVAEYEAVVLGLQRALELGAKEILLRTDSQLVIRQLSGAYRIKSKNLIPRHVLARKLLSKFKKWKVEHVPRAENHGADMLANVAIDSLGDEED